FLFSPSPAVTVIWAPRISSLLLLSPTFTSKAESSVFLSTTHHERFELASHLVWFVVTRTLAVPPVTSKTMSSEGLTDNVGATGAFLHPPMASATIGRSSVNKTFFISVRIKLNNDSESLLAFQIS